MIRSRWKTRSLRAFAVLAALAIIAIVIELGRPGTVMCPLRRVAGWVGIEWQLPALTNEQKAKAEAMARAWKAEMLEQYPELRITPREVLDEENGYLQMGKLGEEEFVKELLDGAQLALYKELDREFDAGSVQKQLEGNAEWVERVEWIAGLKARSSGIRGGPTLEGLFLSARTWKKAYDTLALKSCLAAHQGSEREALHWLRASSNLVDHIQHIETPYFLTETIVLLNHLSNGELIYEEILPRIGPGADLKAWREQLECYKPTPKRLAKVCLGEWHIGGDLFLLPGIAELHLQRALVDPDDVARAWTHRLVHRARQLKKMELPQMEQLEASVPKADLSHEGVALTEQLAMRSWTRGFIRAARLDARALAAMDLLVLERAQGRITAADSAGVTLDPYTGSPFVFDPEARTVSCPGGYPDYEGNEPLKLPW